MTIRARYKIEVGISSTTAEENDLGNHLWEVVSDAASEGGSRRTALAALATDVELSMAEIAAANLVVVRVQAVDPNDALPEITIKRNTTGNEAIEVGPINGAKEAYLLMTMTTGLTALFASNPSASVAVNVTVVAAGD